MKTYSILGVNFQIGDFILFGIIIFILISKIYKYILSDKLNKSYEKIIKAKKNRKNYAKKNKNNNKH